MTALAASDVTLSGSAMKIGKWRGWVGTIVFGDGALTYTSGGVPLPTAANFNMPGAVIKALILFDTNDAAGIVWKYNAAGHTLRGYIQGVVTSTQSGTAALSPLDTTSDPLASTLGVAITSGSAAGTYYFGAMKEIPTTEAPVAQTLYAFVIGW